MELAGCVEGIDRYVILLGYAGIAVRALERRGRTLETAFLRMTGALPSSRDHEVVQALHHYGAKARNADSRNVGQRTAGRVDVRATIRGVLAVFQVEWIKLRAQRWIQPVVAICLLGPWAFVFALRVQDSVPEDTLFGRGVRDSGLAVPLAVLGFSAMWILPALGALVAGDVFSGEDRHGTWSSILTRSRTRSEIFAGKAVLALSCPAAVVMLLGFSSALAGLAGVGHQPLVDLSGALMPAPRALLRTVAAWATVVPPVAAFAALALLISLATHRSTAGVGLPVVAGLLMQLSGFVNGPESVRRLVITSAFGAWHGLINQRPYYGPLVASTIVSLLYCTVSIGIGSWIFGKRDIT